MLMRLVLKIYKNIYHKFPKWPEHCSYPAIVPKAPLPGEEAGLPQLEKGSEALIRLLFCLESQPTLPPRNAEVPNVFRELEPPTGYCCPCFKGYKALSSKKDWEGPSKVRASENLGAHRDLREDKSTGS